MTIRIIEHDSPEYHAALRLRDAILRKPLGLSIADDDLASEATQIHFVTHDEDSNPLLGCVTLNCKGNDAVQMRQLAVTESRRGTGLGKALVEAAEEHAREQMGATILFCHARHDVIAFYEKLGYTAVGAPFTEVTIPHQRMEKALA